MKIIKCLIGALVFALTIILAPGTHAEDASSTRVGQAPVAERASQFEVKMGDAKGDWVKWRAQRPAGVLALYEVANPSLSSDEKVLGMDSTIALGVGLSFFLVVVVAIVAASRKTHHEA
jgi:hypothetical protein